MRVETEVTMRLSQSELVRAHHLAASGTVTFHFGNDSLTLSVERCHVERERGQISSIRIEGKADHGGVVVVMKPRMESVSVLGWELTAPVQV